MSIVKQNTEERLIKYLNTLQQKKFGKMLYVPAAVNTVGHELDLPVMVQLLKKVIDDEQITVFQCEDGGIIVIVNVIRFSLSAMISIISTYMGIESKEMIHVYDIEVDWFKVKTLCEQKHEIYQKRIVERKQRQEGLVQQQYHDAIMQKTMSKELVDTIQKRKREHEQTCILIVEDDLFSRTLVYKTLNKDYAVEVASGGEEAIKQYALKAPNIVFLDIDLPDITGHDVVQKIIEMDSSAYIVMLSGNSDRKNVLKSIQEGAKGFVGKPFSKDKLINYIEDATV